MGCHGSKPPVTPDAPIDRVKFLKDVKLFKRLPPEELPALAKAAIDVPYQTQATIIKQGDQGDAFFVLQSGTADVHVNGKKVATLKQGDFFGENALLRNEPRRATIIAIEPVQALRITREQFTELGLASKLEFPKRGAVGGITNVEVKPPSPKTPEQLVLINKGFRENANLNTIAHLDDDRCKAISDIMWLEEVAHGTQLIHQGDLHADYFYIVQTGTFVFSKSDDSTSAERAAEASVGTVGAGGSFGELALLYFAPRAATVTATTDAKVWVCARHQFKDILLKSSENEMNEHLQYVNSCKVFEPLREGEKKELAFAMQEMTFSKDETIFEQGERGTQFFLLIQGEVSVIKDGKEVNKLQASVQEAAAFGERALEHDEPRAATVKVISETAKALWVDKETFEVLLGSLADLSNRAESGGEVVRRASVAPTAGDSKRFGNIKFSELQTLGLLGCGGFGAVRMVEHKTTGETYALKALSKGYVVKSGMQSSVMSEKNVQLMCDSPFVVKLYETFNGDASLYLLLELALGGELYATYNKKNLWGNEKCAKYYVAGTVFAFEHLHGKKIIFRDLKPENLLLNEKGNVKLTDMGLAKVVVGKTFTTCGTPDYFAPELIQSKGHNVAVDWWTLGVLCYELMVGHPPFESATPMQIYSKVQKGINKVFFPNGVKGKAEILIKSLCHGMPTERLPMKKGGTQNIRSHPWFLEFDFGAMEDFTMTPPYLPVVKSKKDKANFSASQDDLPPQIPYRDDHTGWDKDFATST